LIFYAALPFVLSCGRTGKKPGHKGEKIEASSLGLEGKKHCRIRAWMCFQKKRYLDTPSPELGDKAAVCTRILSAGIVSNALRESS
jgi:hypothetical protein